MMIPSRGWEYSGGVGGITILGTTTSGEMGGGSARARRMQGGDAPLVYNI